METENLEKQPSPVTSTLVVSSCRKKKNEEATFLEGLKDHIYEFINASMDERKSFFKKIIPKFGSIQFGMSEMVAAKNAESKGVENLVVQPTLPALDSGDYDALMRQMHEQTLHTDDYDALMRQMHDQWMIKHGRVYKGELKEERFKSFKENVISINADNAFNAANNKNCRYGLTKFADLTEEEWAYVYGSGCSFGPDVDQERAKYLEKVRLVTKTVENE